MCFTLGWFEQLLVWLVIVIAVVAVLKLLLPFLAGIIPGGGGSIVTGIISIILWAVIAIAVIYICFALIGCLATGGFPLLPHRY